MIARELDAHTLMHRDQVVAVIAEILRKLTALLDGLPASVAPQANPADPELARDAIADHVEQIRAACRRHRSNESFCRWPQGRVSRRRF
jgi:hypothetical protein